LIARLVESYRENGKTKQRIIAHLGTCIEPVENLRHRSLFYERCGKVLARLELSDDDRAKVAAQIAARIPPLNEEDTAEKERAAAAAWARVSGRDGFAVLVSAWSVASEDERQRFIDLMRQGGLIPWRPG
jgi:hypothetical protein